MRSYNSKKIAQFDDSQFVNEDNLDDYLSDNLDDQTQSDLDLIPNPLVIDKTHNRIPPEAVETVYPNPFQLVYDGIKTKEVISFDYTTRHGTYIGKRAVEPHYTFFAVNSGNEILVSFDRTVNDIRAFIIGNIHANGVKYNRVVFAPRGSIIQF